MSRQNLKNLYNKYRTTLKPKDTFEKYKDEHKYENPYYTSTGTFGSEEYVENVKDYYSEQTSDKLKSGLIGNMIVPKKPRWMLVKNEKEKNKQVNINMSQPNIKYSNKQDKYASKCSNKENLSGDKLNTENIIVVILPTNDKYIAYCYEINEIKYIFSSVDKLNKKIYKEPYSGIYFDKQSKDLINSYDTFVAKLVDNNIYTLVPISRNKFLSKEKIKLL